MAFDIRDVLGTVSKSDPGQEQIVYIALDKLDGDPSNFYTLEGIEELADNISLIGLQQPLRIRPGKDGHFIVVSGHRRRAACLLMTALLMQLGRALVALVLGNGLGVSLGFFTTGVITDLFTVVVVLYL